MAFTEKIGTLVKTSTTIVTLTGTSIVKLGGQQRVLTSPALSTATSGIGGIDTGAVGASSFYYVYAVYNGSTTGLVASLSSVSPTGFTRYKKVGAFYTGSSLIVKAYKINEFNQVTMAGKITSAAAINTTNWSFLTGVASGGTGIYDLDITAANLSIAPAVGGGMALTGSGNEAMSYSTLTTTAVRLHIAITTTAAAINDDHSFCLIKQGIDAVQPDWN